MLPDWTSLPEHLLVQVLGLLDQDERLKNSARVNAAWAAAARRATRHATCSLRQQQQQQDSLRDFLHHGDSGVQSVKLLAVGHPQLPVTVPLTGVTRLEVEGAKFPVPGSTLLLSGLRQLDVGHCNSHIPSLAAALQGSCSSLTSLLLGHRWGEDQEPNQLNDLLRPLTVLAELELPCWQGEELPDLPVALTRLQLRRHNFHLHAEVPSDDVSSMLQPLTSLQVLQLHGVSLQHPLSLTGLREVDLDSVCLDMSALSSVHALQRLELTDCSSISGPQFSFSQLQGPSELRRLKLGGPSAAEAVMQLTSLSCISALTQLDLVCALNEQQWDALARDVVSRASGLRKLALGNPFAEPAWDAAHLNLDQLRQIASSCSQLQHLSLNVDVTSPAATAGLMHLPGTCRSLELLGHEWCPTVLAQLTWLTGLVWQRAHNLSDVGLRQLTAVRNLQALSLGWCTGISAEVGRAVEGLGPVSSCEWTGDEVDYRSHVFRLDFQTGEPQGSVCEQLQAVCAASPQCALADVPVLRDELQASRERVEQLQTQNRQLSFAPLGHVVVEEEAAAAGGVEQMRQQLVEMAHAIEGLLSHVMYAALVDGLSGSRPTAEQFAEACAAVREQNALRLLRILKVVVDGGA